MADEKIELEPLENEEIPTNMERLLKVLEIPGLNNEDRLLIREMIEKMDFIISRLDDSRGIKHVSEKIDALRAALETERNDIDELQNRFSSVVGYLEQEKNLGRAFNSDLSSIKSAVDYQKSGVDEISGKFEKLVSLLDSDKDRIMLLQNKFDKLVSILDSDKERAITLNEKFDSLVSLLDSDKERMIKLNEKFDVVSQLLGQDKSSEAIAEINASLGSVLSSVQSNEERIVALFARTLDNLEGISRSLAVLHTDKKEADAKVNVIIESLNEKFDAYVKNVNDRMDNMLLQVLEPLNGISMRLEQKGMGNEDAKKILSAVEEIKKFSETDIRAAVFAEITNNKDIKKLDSEIKRINAQLLLMRKEDALSRIANFRKLVASYRVPKSAQREKKNILNTLKFLETAIIEITILNSIKTKTSFAKIKEDVHLSDRLIKQRILKLIADGKIRKEKKGNYFVYTIIRI